MAHDNGMQSDFGEQALASAADTKSQGMMGDADMSRSKIAAAVLMAVTISVLGIMACIALANLLVPSLLSVADSPWFLPVIFGLAGLWTFSMVFYARHRARP